MTVLKATQQQYDQLNGYTYKRSMLQFTTDGNGNWIVGKQVMSDPDFEAIRQDLQQLIEIEYVPPAGD